MKKKLLIASATLFTLSFFFSASALAAYTVLHGFEGGADDGSRPHTALIADGNTLYGTTNYGGANDLGTIYSMNKDGTNFTLLHEFAGGADDGRLPAYSLTKNGNKLYGATAFGGDNDKGTIYSINTDGTNFTLLHEFAGGANDGDGPYGTERGLVLANGILYGTTDYGGDSDLGTVYSIAVDGTGFTLLHEFAGGANDGSYANGGLIKNGATLYGTTTLGGSSDTGTLYAIRTDGSGFTLFHSFAGGNNDGSSPYNGVMLIGDKLYGTTYGGGSQNSGTVFAISTDGSNFTLLHEFSGGVNGNKAWGNLVTYNGILYGLTESGGNSDMGTIFSIHTDGTNFVKRHDFTGGTEDGKHPEGGLLVSGSKLYGTTRLEDNSNLGNIYVLDLVINEDNPTFKNDDRCLNPKPPLPSWSLYDSSAEALMWSAMGGDAVEILFSDNPAELKYSFTTENDGHEKVGVGTQAGWFGGYWKMRTINGCKKGDWTDIVHVLAASATTSQSTVPDTGSDQITGMFVVSSLAILTGLYLVLSRPKTKAFVEFEKQITQELDK